MTFKQFIIGIFTDEKGIPSSKRFIGIIAGLSLCITMFINCFTEFKPSDSLINAVGLLSFGALGLASVDRAFKKAESKAIPDDTPEESITE